MQSADVAIVGGGIVGLATAYRLSQRHPGRSVVVLEKEPRVGAHQTGHNSGVLHSGIYYRPGSLKARNCRAGKRALESFCSEQGIPFERCGKVVVALDAAELPRLDEIARRARENGVACELVDAAALRELEPHAAGLRALHVPETGIVDYGVVGARLAQLAQKAGHEIRCGAQVERVRAQTGGVVIETRAGEVAARFLVNCAGLQSDRIARLCGVDPGVQIVPFRGEYYELLPGARGLCRNLIYPVPDPAFPFLGVHFTRMISGGVECGPNAVLAFAREGYRRRDLVWRDLAETLAFGGFRRLAARYWRTGIGEMIRSASKRAFVAALRRLVPAIEAGQLVPAEAGVRAQAVAPDGSLVDDFLIRRAGPMVHVCNAPSPAATSCLNIGGLVVDELDAAGL